MYQHCCEVGITLGSGFDSCCNLETEEAPPPPAFVTHSLTNKRSGERRLGGNQILVGGVLIISGRKEWVREGAWGDRAGVEALYAPNTAFNNFVSHRPQVKQPNNQSIPNLKNQNIPGTF